MVELRGIDLINYCKVATLACIGSFAYIYGFQTMRAYVYTAMHVSYLIWWFLHQRLSPKWGPSVFGESDIPLPVVTVIFLIVGPGYSLPAYYAFKATEEPNPLILMAAIMVYSWGSLINVAADFYKDGCKVADSGALVTQGPYRLARHINWFGDWLRYSSFALASGNATSLLIPGWTAFFNLTSLPKKQQMQAARGGAVYEKYAQQTPAIIPWRLLL